MHAGGAGHQRVQSEGGEHEAPALWPGWIILAGDVLQKLLVAAAVCQTQEFARYFKRVGRRIDG